MTSAVFSASSAITVDEPLHKPQTAKLLFFGALATVTLLPLAIFNLGLDHALLRSRLSAIVILSLMAATNVGHVLSTALFYVDEEFSELIRENPRRFLSLPAFMIFGCYVLYSLSAAGWMLLVSAYNVWQLYHYQRQNYGIVAFAAQGSAQKLPPGVKWTLDLTLTGGACNMLASLWLKAGSPAAAAVHGLTAILFVAALVVLIRLAVKSAQLRSNPWALLFVAVGWVFFLPTFVHQATLLSVWAIGFAHGAQYLVFMAVIAGNRKRSVVGLALLALVMVPSFFLFLHLSTKLLMAVYTGVVMGHFVIDAKVWRLREPLQRHIIGERFSFVLS